jgi:hypothetical protein
MPLYTPSVASPNLTGPASITFPGDTGTHALDIVSNAPSLGSFVGYSRTYFGQFGELNTQAWMTISGKYKDLGGGKIAVIVPGGTKGSPTYYVGNRLNGFTGGMLGVSNDIVGPNILLQDNQLTAGGNVATSATVVSGGSSYTIGDTLTVSGGTATPATDTFIDSVELGGSGYTVNDILTIAGGNGTPATVKVTAVTLGAVTAVTALTTGAYTVLPSNTAPTTGGTGTGCYINVIWPSKGPTVVTVTSVSSGVITGLSISRPGRYSSIPTGTLSLSGGTGTGATATVTWSSAAEQSRHVECLDYAKNIRFQIRSDGTNIWGNSQDIEGFVASNADIFGIDNNNLGTHATFNAPRLNIAGDSQLGNLATQSATRTIAPSVGSTTAIGSFQLSDPASAGPAAIRIMLTIYGTGIATSKIYDLVSAYNLTTGAWWQLVPVASVLQPATTSDHAIDVNIAAGVLSLRLRNVSASVVARAEISMIVNGPAANAVFTPATATAIGVVTPVQLYTGKLPTSVDLVTKSIAAPITGATVTIPVGTPLQIINPAGTLAVLFVALPAGQVDGQKQAISFQQAITQLYVSATGASNNWVGASAVSAFQRIEFTYNAADFKWYRTQ